jgi:hypothetical protein
MTEIDIEEFERTVHLVRKLAGDDLLSDEDRTYYTEIAEMLLESLSLAPRPSKDDE